MTTPNLLGRYSDRALAGALAGALFVLYAIGACRTIYVGDSGELVTAVYLVGIPHPSGYPLYVLLGKLWTLLLPLGSVAFRMSLFSAACAALTGGVLFALGRSARLGRLAAGLTASLAALAPSFWAEANVQRVYALGALFVALSTWAALRWEQQRSGGRLALVAFLTGLGATNHTFMLVFAAAFALFAVVVEPTVLRRWRDLLAAAAAFCAGLLPYLFLPLRSRQDPALDWGDPETFDRFLAVVGRRDFWDRRWLETPADWLPISADFLRSFPAELGWGGAALVLLGLAFGLRRRQPAVGLALLVITGNLVAMGLHGSRSDIFLWHRYYIPSYLMAALLAGLAAQALADRLPRRVALLLLALPLTQLLLGYRLHDRSTYRIAEDYSRRLLADLPPGADLIASDDNILFVLLYLKHVEGLRPDVHLVAQGVGAAELPPLRIDPQASRLYFTHHPNWQLPELEVVPEGLTFHVRGRGVPGRRIALDPPELDGEADPRVPKDYLTRNLIGDFHSMRARNLEQQDWRQADAAYRRAAASAPENDVLFYNLGLIYERRGLLREALEFFERSHAINPRHLATGSRVRAADKIAELQARLASAP